MTQPLTNLQKELLKSFNFSLDEAQLQEVKQLLIDYFASKVSNGMDNLFDDNGWDNSKLEEWASERMRSTLENESPA